MRLIERLAWSYGCESWKISIEGNKSLEAFEMWWHQMLRISWMVRVTNMEVVKKRGKYVFYL